MVHHTDMALTGTKRRAVLRARPRGFWYPDLALTLSHYPRTQEAFDRMQERGRLQMAKQRAEGGLHNKGAAHGWAGRKVELQKARNDAKVLASKVVTIMKTDETIDPDIDPRAETVLTEMLGIVMAGEIDPATGLRRGAYTVAERTKAAALFLGFTKAKPEQKIKQTLAGAEDLLGSLITRASRPIED